MRTIALAAAAFVMVSLTSLDARADGTWCAYHTKGGTNCGFHSYAQCMTNLSGIGGSCGVNPAYQSNAGDSRRRSRDWRY